jgi:hypothetical protein
MSVSARLVRALGTSLGTFVLLLPAGLHAQAVTGFKSGEVTTGMTKQCIYSVLGSEHTLTISAVQLCPLTVQVPAMPSYSAPQAPSMGNRGVGFKTGEQVTGMTKQCYYSYLGSTVSRTVSSVSLCPLTIPIGD